MTTCRYVKNGNLCTNDKFCESKSAFSRPVNLESFIVYGICEEAEVY